MQNYNRITFSIDAVVAICVLLFCAVSCSQDPCAPIERQAAPTSIYQNDFSRVPSDEWSVSTRKTSPTGVQFLGLFGAEDAQLSLENLPSHTSLTLTFKLYIVWSWDGNANNDRWKCSVQNGPTLLMASFSNTTSKQSYPLTDYVSNGGYSSNARTGASAVDSLRIVSPLGYNYDSIYDIAITFPHSESSIVIEFRGLTSEELNNESWGIDDVSLWKGPANFPTN